MNSKILAEVKSKQPRKNVVRHFTKFLLCNIAATLAIICHNLVAMSFFNFATTLSIDVCKNFISNKLTTWI